jgi:hypothetical protein
MRGALKKLLPGDHQSFAKRSCKSRNNNDRPKHQNMRVLFSSAASFFDALLGLGGAAYSGSGWGVFSLVTSFYGNGEAKFSDKVPAESPQSPEVGGTPELP